MSDFSDNTGANAKGSADPKRDRQGGDSVGELVAHLTDAVDTQITDAVTQTNVMALGIGPAFAIVQSFLSQSQAQGVLFANMVHDYQQLGTAGLATTVQSVIQILNLGDKGLGKS